jgi:probable phosphoglycerate mutase
VSPAGRRVVVQADGGSRGNPGPAGFGAVVLDATTGAVLAERKESIGRATNNVAEYRGLIAGLEAAAELGATEVAVQMDSKLVVEQMSGRWRIKHADMQALASTASQLRSRFGTMSFQWIPREQNKHADRLANEAMDTARERAGDTARERAGDTARERAGDTARERAGDTARERAPDSGRDGAAPAVAAPPRSWAPPSTTATRLVLVRHGSTPHSLAHRFSGRNDLALTELGERQAAALSGRVARFAPVAAVIASPLRRARQTADAVAGPLGVPVEFDEGLTETDFGVWEGLTFAEIQERWPAELNAWLASPDLAPPDGESFTAVAERVRRSRDAILAAWPDQTVVVVSHVTPIKTLLRLALDAPAESMYRLHLDTASVSVADYFADGNCSVRLVNDTSHLFDLVPPPVQ